MVYERRAVELKLVGLHQLELAVAGTPAEGLAEFVNDLFGADEVDIEAGRDLEEAARHPEAHKPVDIFGEDRPAKRAPEEAAEDAPVAKAAKAASNPKERIVKTRQPRYAVAAPVLPAKIDKDARIKLVSREGETALYKCSVCPLMPPNTNLNTVKGHMNKEHWGVVLKCYSCANWSNASPDVYSQHKQRNHPDGVAAPPAPAAALGAAPVAPAPAPVVIYVQQAPVPAPGDPGAQDPAPQPLLPIPGVDIAEEESNE